MTPKPVNQSLSVSGQISAADIEQLAREGFRSIICNRPDGEELGQPEWLTLEAAAKANGLETRFIPVTPDTMGPEAGASFGKAMAGLPAPVLAFCRTGNRSEMLAKMAGVAPRPSTDSSGTPRHQVVIIGGGAGGISAAASLLRRRPKLDIAIIEPSEEHYYQPGWTLVGGGVFRLSDTRKPMAEIMPRAATWVKARAAGFDPEKNEVLLEDGRHMGYDLLIVAAGNRLAWEEIDGLEQALGQYGVTSNYRYDLSSYTWRLVEKLREGRALFTQPPMPIKCAGAPQKAMYLSCSAWEKVGALRNIDVEFHNAGAALFGVPAYLPALQATVERYGIAPHYGSNLVAVNGPDQTATFKTETGEVTLDFDMLHVCPPQKSVPAVADSPLADAAGYAEVDQFTMQHMRYPNVFALGDGCSTPNAKTAAAVRQQAPVVAVNALCAIDGMPMKAAYNGYGSCPLTVERGKIVLAEFAYGGALDPSFPKWLIDGTKPSRLSWFLKEKLLPPIYWEAMLKGREWLAKPKSLSSVTEAQG